MATTTHSGFEPFDVASDVASAFRLLAATMSHDLQTPLWVACDAVDRIRTSDSSVDAADEAILYLRDISEYVRDLGRLAAEQLALEQLCPSSLLREVLASVECRAKWKGVVFELRGRSRSISGDRSLLTRAITALVEISSSTALALAGPRARILVSLSDCPSVENIVIDIHIAVAGEQRPIETSEPHGHQLGLVLAACAIQTHGGATQTRSRLAPRCEFRVVLPNRSLTSRLDPPITDR